MFVMNAWPTYLVFWKINLDLVSIYFVYCKFHGILFWVEKHVFRSKQVLKCDIITCNSLQNIRVIPEMDSHTKKRKAAIFDLFNMAATAGIQLGSLKKLVCFGHIYT